MVDKSKEILFKDVKILLLPQKVVFLPDHNIMILADWHLGKATHFRKEGIYMPYAGTVKELDKLKLLIINYKPETIVFLGDLFHSHINSEWDIFTSFIKYYPDIRFILTIGNHDILPVATFENAGLEVVPYLIIGETIICTHIPMDIVPENRINMAGHVHPGCSIDFLGRQQFRLPCFYYYDQRLLLPAFGELTGFTSMQQLTGAKIYPVLDNEVVEWIS